MIRNERWFTLEAINLRFTLFWVLFTSVGIQRTLLDFQSRKKHIDTLLCGFYNAQTYCTSNEQKVAVLVHVSPHYHGYCRSDRGRFTLGSSGTAALLHANASPATC